MSRKKCSEKECDKMQHAKGLCMAHYKKAYKEKLEANKEYCIFIGCKNKQHAKEYCSMHYRRFIKFGDAAHIPPRAIKTKKCKIDGCEKPYSCKDFCKSHYELQRVFGDAKTITKNHKDAKEKFLSLFENDGDNCWIWKGPKTSANYGSFMCQGITYYAHRFSYELFVGSIPENMHVCHKCDTPECVNFSHMFIGTAKDNSDDKVAKGRQTKGEDHPFAKLTEDDVMQIRLMIKNGFTDQEVSDEFDYSRKAVNMLRHNKRWRHLKWPD